MTVLIVLLAVASAANLAAVVWITTRRGGPR